MLQSIYADRRSDEVLAVSASPDVRTDDSDVKSNLDTGEGSANREPCDNPTRMSDAPVFCSAQRPAIPNAGQRIRGGGDDMRNNPHNT